MRREGADEATLRRAIATCDTKGLVHADRAEIDDDKREFALDGDALAHYDYRPAEGCDLQSIIAHVKPTFLIGTSGRAGSFTEAAIREMAGHVETPVIFPLSNPTANTEAVPSDILAWTGGGAIVATGSPFDPVEVGGRMRLIGQANNVYVFPGIGLGTIVAEAHEVTDEMILVAARTLAGLVSEDRLAQGAIYPPQTELRRISRQIALAVVCEARNAGVGRAFHDDQVEPAVDAAIWYPDYVPYFPD